MVSGSELTSSRSKTKSADALRTIGEVADWLDLPTHVLRFWESKFSQVKPVRLTGSRRYYRPKDMLILGGIKKLLHEDGMTIKGVQNQIRTKGIEFVIGSSQSLGFEAVTAVAEQQIELPFDTGTAMSSKSQRIERGSLFADAHNALEPAAIATGAFELQGGEEKPLARTLETELSNDPSSDIESVFGKIELQKVFKLEVLSLAQKSDILPLVEELILFRDALKHRKS
ncbi:MAG: MerR family transcriptional regulator [Aestuariivita sp.]|nr:MerR family transcriptional regulator [Aestuariivita sp.]MCY4203280.1 MerR family transcriptional regulator [Aestuariivita sp.]MCY4287193.1 MerR family transcriptional regulator [Aestuariivita sp.]MCY4347499.1 MerR family transcriptional regulator [Aestuariivita sp.]